MKKHLRWLIVITIVAVGLLGFAFVINHSYIDFPVYHLAARSLLSGRTDLYAPDFAAGRLMDYRYPPFFIYVFSPLGLLPYLWAAYVWFWVCLLSIVGSVVIVHRLAKEQLDSSSVVNKKLVWTVAFFAVGQYFVMALFCDGFALRKRPSFINIFAALVFLLRDAGQGYKFGVAACGGDYYQNHSNTDIALFCHQKALELSRLNVRLRHRSQHHSEYSFRFHQKFGFVKNMVRTRRIKSRIS